MIEANIKADAQPAARAMDTIATISCPAPFERLEVLFRAPTIGNRTTRKPYEDQAIGGSDTADRRTIYLSMILFGKPVPTPLSKCGAGCFRIMLIE
jgi:hypothetical protein